MEGIVNFEVWLLVLMASFVIAKLFNAIKSQAAIWWTSRTDRQREHWGWAIIAVSAGLMWLTGLNGLPGFSAVWPPGGRILTCIAAGFGPGLVYDIWMDRPQPLPETPAMAVGLSASGETIATKEDLLKRLRI